jgi:pimeloyl-ACP methyl ester carboxylesterase
MPTPGAATEDFRAPNGLFYRTIGRGEPLLLLHGLMVGGAMFDPLVEWLRTDFRMIIPDLRGHGRSGDLPGPYDVAALAGDLDAVLRHAGADRCSVLGYSHGGAVAQQLAHSQPAMVERMMLVCTYACNASTPRERVEASVLQLLLRALTPGMLGQLIVRLARPGPGGEVAMDPARAVWLAALMGANRAAPMRAAARGLVTFDSRPWLADIDVPTVVVGGAHDSGVPRHHFDTLVKGIAGARGLLVERAGHTLIWTHTREFADIVRGLWKSPDNPLPPDRN